MKLENQIIYGNFSIIRPVTEEDAAFIVGLRNEPQRCRFISATASSVEKQREWIRGFLERNSEGLEYYYIACDSSGNAWGTVRLYDILKRECTGGSWVMKPGSPLGISLESYLAPLFLAFEVLKMHVMHIDVRKGNKRVLQWHESCGAIYVREDAENRYYDYTPEVYPLAARRVYNIL